MFILALFLTLLMLLVILWDCTRFIIPNWLVGLVIVAYPALVLLSPQAVDWKMALLAGSGAFVFGFLLFSFRIMGGGDVKLLAACCLWTGLAMMVEFILYTSILGGALAIFLLSGRPLAQYISAKLFPNKPAIRLFQKGEPAPYGVAIAGAFLTLLWQGKLFAF
jgi:prepilin peptidase CpaA